ncbi:MAG: restriction endonuclease [Solirubrobacteraceae bacterium MAG38_C4-C5]|nr:restriction endonuclease [Candidatus Siliceabacter maunaloa]
MVDRLDFEGWDETDFEEFCFQLLDGLDGFSNVDWRKGTPKQASPVDRGRDIVADVERVDVDQAKHVETWFVDCKHYSKGVPPEALQGLLAWANAERPQVALIIASGYLSNACKDYLRDYEEHNRPPFRIKYWERPILDKLTRGNRKLLDRFLLGGMRSQSEIIAAEQAFFDRVWHERHLVGLMRHESGESPMKDGILKGALEAAERVRTRRPAVRPVEDDFEWGMWNGKLSALRWVLGEEWDLLDT